MQGDTTIILFRRPCVFSGCRTWSVACPFEPRICKGFVFNSIIVGAVKRCSQPVGSRIMKHVYALKKLRSGASARNDCVASTRIVAVNKSDSGFLFGRMLLKACLVDVPPAKVVEIEFCAIPCGSQEHGQ